MVKFVVVSLVVMFLIGYISHISTVRVDENKRVAIFNLGQFKKVIGPEGGNKIPMMDVAIMVDLTKHLPGWHSMSEVEIKEQVKALVIKGGVGGQYL